MARISLFPFVALAAIGALALFGDRQEVYGNVDQQAICTYTAASTDAAPADILLAGASRFNRGLDPVYMTNRISDLTGSTVHVERLVLNTPNIVQFRPLLSRYIEERGAPRYVVFPVLFNFKEGRQRGWDTPIHTLRNLTYASSSELISIQQEALLNDYQTPLPRSFEADYMSVPAMMLQKIEINVWAALRWPVNLRWQEANCEGDQKYRTGIDPRYGDLHDDLEFTENPRPPERQARNLAQAQNFLPLDPNAPWRQFEADQLRALIKMLEDEGSTVILTIMPSLGDTEITDTELADIATAFPGIPLIHPYSLFETEIGQDLARSFSDTHHATAYGALIYSQYFSDALAAHWVGEES